MKTLFSKISKRLELEIFYHKSGFRPVRIPISGHDQKKVQIPVRFVETHDYDKRNMIDVSGKTPKILNYTPKVPMLNGKQEEIFDPVQLKFFALFHPKTHTIAQIMREHYCSYRQARYIKLYQKNIIARDPRDNARLFLDLCFL